MFYESDLIYSNYPHIKILLLTISFSIIQYYTTLHNLRLSRLNLSDVLLLFILLVRVEGFTKYSSIYSSGYWGVLKENTILFSWYLIWRVIWYFILSKLIVSLVLSSLIRGKTCAWDYLLEKNYLIFYFEFSLLLKTLSYRRVLDLSDPLLTMSYSPIFQIQRRLYLSTSVENLNCCLPPFKPFDTSSKWFASCILLTKQVLLVMIELITQEKYYITSWDFEKSLI